MDLKEAMRYLVWAGAEMEKPEVVEICGKTYCTKDLKRYDEAPKAAPIVASSLTALVDYIKDCHNEFPGPMIIYVESPKTVRLMSSLDQDRKREELFRCQANVSEFQFDRWYDQENFIINLQANFAFTEDLGAIRQVAGNIEAKTVSNYGDDGVSQKATVSRGIAGKEDVIVLNPCILTPYRTFQEVEQPSSAFVFRIGDEGVPRFKLIEADNNIWKCNAIQSIKEYLTAAMEEIPDETAASITIIG